LHHAVANTSGHGAGMFLGGEKLGNLIAFTVIL
jgi:hypothetical protein